MKFYLLSSLDSVEEVLVVRNARTEAFVGELARLVPRTGAKLTPLDFDTAHNDVWMQDAVEIGSLLSEDRSAQETAILAGLRGQHFNPHLPAGELDKVVKAHFEARGATVFAWEPRFETRWIDWFGNLEVSPPVTDASGRLYPQGRVLVGVQNGLTMHPDVLEFLAAQGVQTPPVFVDVSWLTIGHVDEVINFVPAPEAYSFKVLFPSPCLAREILEGLVLEGRGQAAVFAGKGGETTVERLLKEVALSEENRSIEKSLEKMKGQLREELGIPEDGFLEMPTLFQSGLAVIPNSVNSLVCNGTVFVPAPCGPQIGGLDVFEEAVRVPLEALGLTVHFLDVWEPYHTAAGEIHCGTNAIRRLRL